MLLQQGQDPFDNRLDEPRGFRGQDGRGGSGGRVGPANNNGVDSDYLVLKLVAEPARVVGVYHGRPFLSQGTASLVILYIKV